MKSCLLTHFASMVGHAFLALVALKTIYFNVFILLGCNGLGTTLSFESDEASHWTCSKKQGVINFMDIIGGVELSQDEVAQGREAFRSTPFQTTFRTNFLIEFCNKMS